MSTNFNVMLNELPTKQLPEIDTDDKVRNRALWTMEQGHDVIENQQRIGWEKIIDQHDGALSTDGPTGPRFMHSKDLFNVKKKLRERIIDLKWDIVFVNDEDTGVAKPDASSHFRVALTGS